MPTIIIGNETNIQKSTKGWQVRAYLAGNVVTPTNDVYFAADADGNNYLFAPFVAGFDDIPDITLPVSESIKFTSLGIYDKRGNLYATLLSDFYVYASLGNAITLTNLILANQSPPISNIQRSYRSYTDEQIDKKDNQITETAFAQIVGQIDDVVATILAGMGNYVDGGNADSVYTGGVTRTVNGGGA